MNREEIREALAKGADNGRIAIRIIEWCLHNMEIPEVREAAIAQVQAVCKLSVADARALVSEFLV